MPRIQIDRQIAEKIKTFIGKGTRSRADILTHIGENSKVTNTPFDIWAKKYLDKIGRGIFKIKIQDVHVPQEALHVRLTTNDKQSIADLAAMEALLSTERILTSEIVARAGTLSGIRPLPIGLKTAIEPYFQEAWGRLLSSLLMDKPPAIEIREMDKPIDRFKTEELFAELLRRMPQYIPLVSGFYASLSTDAQAQLPSVQKLTAPVQPKREIPHLLVTGLYSRQSSEFLQRPKIDNAIRNNMLRLTFIDQDRTRWTFPATVSKVFMFDKRSHKLWNALCAAYGTNSVAEFHGVTALEDMIFSALK